MNIYEHICWVIVFRLKPMQEAQAALLAKEDDLAMLRQDLQALRTQLKRASDSAAQSATGQHSAGHTSAAQTKGQSSSSLKPDQEANTHRKAESAGIAESGLPSPSLPATPHSPVDSPRGETAAASLPPHPRPSSPPHPPPPPYPAFMASVVYLVGHWEAWSAGLQDVPCFQGD